MYIDKEHFEAWMERIMARFSRLDKTLDKMGQHRNMLDGELLLVPIASREQTYLAALSKFGGVAFSYTLSKDFL